jgi:phosphatidylglycerophosphatase GEP4
VPDHELIVVGDRILTDVVMANRMKRRLVKQRSPLEKALQGGPLAIWTTAVWEQDGRFMRWCENKLVTVVQRWTALGPDAADPDNLYVRKEA